jgi:DNA-binding NtrC family response regulator
MMDAKILIVDDESRMAEVIAMALTRSGHTAAIATSGADALEAFDRAPADLVITDWKMPGMDGVELLKALKQKAPSLPVILITAHADVPSAVAAMREGAFDYVTKPFDNDELRAVVHRALEMSALLRENHDLRKELLGLTGQFSVDGVVAVSKKSRDMLALVHRVAGSNATVLVLGESGTGKEIVARLVHYQSSRVGRPFVAVNCKAFAEGVLESELFGHEKGAFTGASSSRAGCFERADGGTLFLDEIGEVSIDFQAKLLRVLETREVLRVGGSRAKPIDVRIVAATNRPLKEEVQKGRFREDLYFRLNVIPIQLAPLRERREDILPLAEHFLERHHRRSGSARLILGKEAAEILVAHDWPGNVRELENAIERAVVLARSEEIQPEDLLLEAPGAEAEAPDDEPGTLQAHLDRTAEKKIRAALAVAHDQKNEAARALGIDRTTLYRWMKRLGMKAEP